MIVTLPPAFVWIWFSVSVCVYLLLQHISSRRHKDRAAGKPAKPKFSPYTPIERHQSLQAVSILLRLCCFFIPHRCVYEFILKSRYQEAPHPTATEPESLQYWLKIKISQCYTTINILVSQYIDNFCFYLLTLIVTCVSSDKTYSTEEPGPEQTSGLLSLTTPPVCRRCCRPGTVDAVPPPANHKLKPRPVSQSAPLPGAASPSGWTHLFTTHTSSLFPLLTPESLWRNAGTRPEQNER